MVLIAITLLIPIRGNNPGGLLDCKDNSCGDRQQIVEGIISNIVFFLIFSLFLMYGISSTLSDDIQQAVFITFMNILHPKFNNNHQKARSTKPALGRFQ